MAGSISDGSGARNYTNQQLCAFVFGMQTNILDRAQNASFRTSLRITEMALEASFDFLLLYATPPLASLALASLPNWIGSAGQSRLLVRMHPR